MKRWRIRLSRYDENPRVDAFLADVLAVCSKHGLTLSHEDDHGAFIVVEEADGDPEWLLGAFDDTAPTKGGGDGG